MPTMKTPSVIHRSTVCLATVAFFLLSSSFFLASAAEPPPAASQEGVQLWEDGPFWADRNVGADEPWGGGLYFWWGDVIGYRWEEGRWAASDGSSSDFEFAKKVDSIPIYGKNATVLLKEGRITEGGVLAPAHDAARAHWGGEWRMPTKQELVDLAYNKCDWTWTTTNGVAGAVVRGRGDYAAAAIFLPTAGWANQNRRELRPNFGFLWASDPRTDSFPGSWRIQYTTRECFVFYHWDRFMGTPVRPVRGGLGRSAGHGDAAGQEQTKPSVRPAGPACAPEELLAAAEGEPAAQTGVRLWEGGPLWADRNVGAGKPSENGWFFCWGGTVGCAYDLETKRWAAVDGSDPLHGFDEYRKNTPAFGKDADTLLRMGFATADGALAPAHDAARANWGGAWRMPTRRELDGLVENCDWTWTTNGVKGCVVRGRGDYADAAIFLPAAGYAVERKWWDRDRAGYLWSVDAYTDAPPTDCSWRLHFGSSGAGTSYCWDRHVGGSIRPVKDE